MPTSIQIPVLSTSGVPYQSNQAWDFATARAMNGNATMSTLAAGFETNSYQYTYLAFCRCGLFFDTSVLGKGTIIHRARLAMYLTKKHNIYNANGYVDIVACKSNHHIPLINSDLEGNRGYGDELGRISIKNNTEKLALTLNAYNYLYFTDLSFIDVNGISKINLQNDADRYNHDPQMGSSQVAQFVMQKSSDANPAYLDINYSRGAEICFAD